MTKQLYLAEAIKVLLPFSKVRDKRTRSASSSSSPRRDFRAAQEAKVPRKPIPKTNLAHDDCFRGAPPKVEELHFQSRRGLRSNSSLVSTKIDNDEETASAAT